MRAKILVISLIVICLLPSAFADVSARLTVGWLPFAGTYSTGRICVENTTVFGTFDAILLEYTYDAHLDTPPSPINISLSMLESYKYCADLAPELWNSKTPANTLSNAQISVKKGSELLFQDMVWSTDTGLAVDDSLHKFYDLRPQIILINEFESNPLGDDSGNEWIELYNPGDAPVNISGWQITNFNNNTKTIPQGSVVNPHEYFVYSITSQYLGNTNEQIVLKNTLYESDRTAIKSDSANDGRCWSRIPTAIDNNIDSDWLFQLCTKNWSNNDKDHDGYDDKSSPVNGTDCNDNNSSINPSVAELCNNKDDNCNSLVDENLTLSCGSGVCSGVSVCSKGVWQNCSSKDNDAGVCAKCDFNGSLLFDAAQNSDCVNNTITRISTCYFSPDSLNYTYDYYSGFSSLCSAINTCTQVPTNWQNSITHTCNKSACSAECEKEMDCDDNNNKTIDTCALNCSCIHIPAHQCITDADCNNNLYCDGVEYCDANGSCKVNVTDCSANNIFVNECKYLPDSINRTFDYFSFTSHCDEGADTCTLVPSNWKDMIIHTCNKTRCNAECDSANLCVNKCVNDVYYSNGLCNGSCSCSYQSQNCNNLDNWYNTTDLQWSSTGQCKEKEQLKKEYRNYSCSVSGCQYFVETVQWTDTGNTRNKNEGTTCDDGYYCTVGELCANGVCKEGKERDCSGGTVNISQCFYVSDGNNLTYDYYLFTSLCDENADKCTGPAKDWLSNIVHTCDKSICGAECINESDCDDANVRTRDVCNRCVCTHEPTGVCVKDSDCDNSKYCDGIETCNNDGFCSPGTKIDCSVNSLPDISSCNYDSIFKTFDYYQGFNSSCIEKTSSYECAVAPFNWQDNITHTCDKIKCGAGCSSSTDCPVTFCDNLDGCYGGVYRDYKNINASCSAECECQDNECTQYTEYINDLRCRAVAEAHGPYKCNEGNTISVYGTGTSLSNGTITGYLWDLDNDGSFDDASGNVTSYECKDDYNGKIWLKVIDSSGNGGIDEASLEVNNLAPTAHISAYTEGDVGVPITFNSNAFDVSNDILSYSWNFGDSDKSTEKNPQHTYSKSGTYSVQLTVRDDDGGIVTDTFSIKIYEVAKVAVNKNISIFSLPLVPKGSVTFNDVQKGCDLAGLAYYDADKHSYVLLDGNARLYPGQGYFIKVKDECSLVVRGTPFEYNSGVVGFEGTGKLKAGWNMIGATNKRTHYWYVKGNCVVTSGPWRYFDQANTTYDLTAYIDPGKGYWIEVQSPCSFNGNART